MKTIVFVLLSVMGLSAQTSGGVISLGTPYPKVTISPGQIAALSFTGASTILPLDSQLQIGLIQASKLPLPTSLGGFSATINQGPNGYLATLPLFSVSQSNICDPPETAPACVLTLMKVQIPVDLEISPFPIGPGQATFIQVSDQAAILWQLYVALDPVKVHILTACDSVPSELSPGGRINSSSACNPIITHADGTPASPFSGAAGKPAHPGETLVLYATGLGATSPPVPAGTASPSPPAVSARHFSLIFNYDCPAIQTATPSFVGLTPGLVGLYQVNFTVPPEISCTAFPSAGDAIGSAGNLTLLSDDWISSDTVLLFLGANSATFGAAAR